MSIWFRAVGALKDASERVMRGKMSWREMISGPSRCPSEIASHFHENVGEVITISRSYIEYVEFEEELLMNIVSQQKWSPSHSKEQKPIGRQPQGNGGNQMPFTRTRRGENTNAPRWGFVFR